MPKNSGSIDLLQKQNVKGLDRFVNWALTIGRVLVILTESIALIAFLYRFGLDQQNIDLSAKIKQEQAIVTALQNSENTYRNLQDRLSLASQLIANNEKRKKIYDDIISLTPQGLVFKTLSLYPDRLQVDANTNSVESLSFFINSLRNYPAISSVSINKIENKTADASISVSITALLKPSYKTYESSN